MTRIATLLCLSAATAGVQAEQPQARSIDLREVIQIALVADPDVRLAQLAVERSANALALVRAERATQLYGGSGLGATAGIPQSVLGASPSIAQITLRQPLLDTERPGRARGAREEIRSGEHEAAAIAERAAYLAGIAYLDFELALAEHRRRQGELEHFQRIESSAAARVEEGFEIPLALSRARLDTARALDRLAASQSRADLLEAELRRMLGLGPDVRLVADGSAADSAAVLDAAHGIAGRPIGEHPEIAALDAGLRAARHRASSAKSARNPRLDIVGQYSLLARFNNYDDFFRRFQRHNWQAGIAVEVPIFTGRGVAERVARARLDERELSLRKAAKRTALELATQRAGAALEEAQRGRALAGRELAYARESLDVLLAQFEEGRIALEDLQRGRIEESAAWGGLIAAEYELAKARLGSVYAAGRIRDAFAD
ncbi:MAG: TolC family protein [Bryobacterales bacterium]|nr:TolC family protein [Bryobacterales bacterium]MDE0621138.1 TolC family protein [Bryobacterales bacterium]